MRIACDLHIHSCLSPCGDNDMTPNNIVHMAKLKGLDAIALTDHNSCLNCGAAARAGACAGLLVVPGMELCTAEDIHCICLFATVAAAEAFGREVRALLPDIPNRPDIFGEQLVLDEGDNAVGREERLLINAAAIDFDSVYGLVRAHGGTAFPAHADKAANGVAGILGALPPEAGFPAAELSPSCDAEAFVRANPSFAGLPLLHDSDAHYLWQIAERDAQPTAESGRMAGCNFLEVENRTAFAVVSALNRTKKPEKP